MQYHANIEQDGDGFLVTFPDIPEAITGGSDRHEALGNAVEALELALLNHTDAGEDMPVPRFSGGETITVPAQTQAKLAFIASFRQAGTTRVALASKLGKAEGEIRRMLDPYHATKLPALEAGLRALGKRLVLSVEEAA